MDIYLNTQRSLSTSSSDNALFAVAVNSVIPIGDGGATAKYLLYADVLPTGTKNGLGTIVGGTSNPTKSVQPAYFPFATQGAECAAVVKSLDWADANLEQGYEHMLTNNDSTNGTIFVSGVLNSSETDFNNPFSGTDFLTGCCWEGDYQSGVNPF